MSGFLLLLGMGAVTWYALPAAPTWQTKFWSGFLAVFLCPFSWPWLIARGYRVRKHRKMLAAKRAMMEAAAQRQASVKWWLNELRTAMRDGEHDRVDLAAETLRALGYFDFCDCQRCRVSGDPSHQPAWVPPCTTHRWITVMGDMSRPPLHMICDVCGITEPWNPQRRPASPTA